MSPRRAARTPAARGRGPRTGAASTAARSARRAGAATPAAAAGRACPAGTRVAITICIIFFSRWEIVNRRPLILGWPERSFRLYRYFSIAFCVKISLKYFGQLWLSWKTICTAKLYQCRELIIFSGFRIGSKTYLIITYNNFFPINCLLLNLLLLLFYFKIRSPKLHFRLWDTCIAFYQY